MRFSLRALFRLTLAVALWTWMGTMYPEPVIALTILFVMAAISFGMMTAVDALWDHRQARRRTKRTKALR
jgi:hypothetical protein